MTELEQRAAPSMAWRLPLIGTAARDTLIVARRNVQHFLRQPQVLIFSTIQPVLLVLLFTFVFGGALEEVLPPGVDYVDFVLPGIMIQTVAFGSAQTAVGMAQDLEEGIVDRFRTLPMARSAVLAGRVLADGMRIVITATVVTVVGVLLGYRFQDGALAAVAAYLVVLSFGLAFSWVAAWIGMTVRSVEAAQSAGFIWLFPLTFASSAFVAIETFDPWLNAFAEVNPMTIFIDLIRGLTLSGEPYRVTTALVAQACAWLAGILFVFAPLAVRQYRRRT